MILKLGRGERKLPAGKVSPLERQLHGEAILEMTSPPAASQRRPTKIIQDRQETANNTWQPTPAKPPNRQTAKPAQSKTATDKVKSMVSASVSFVLSCAGVVGGGYVTV
jgi:hypothetical protein